MSEKYYGNYVGIVISEPSLDPEGRNRAQVWIPSLTNTLYKGWNDTQNDKKRSNLSVDMVNRLKSSLPWAECASPLIGGGAPFYSNSATGISSSSYEETVVNDNQNLDTQEEPIDPLPPLEPDLSMPISDIPPDDQIIADDDAVLMRTTAPQLRPDGEVKAPAQTQPKVVSGVITNDGALNLYNINSSSVIGRANWGSTDRGNYNWFKGMIVHDDGSGGATTLDGLISWANQSNLGYTAGIKPNGEWVQFVPFNKQTNHAGSGQIPGAGNSGTIGVILIGVDERVGKFPTQQQYNTLTAAADALNIKSIGGHGEYTTRKVAGEGLLAAQYVRDKLGIGDLTTIADGSIVDRGTGIGESLPETDVASTPSVPNDYADANSSVPYGGAGTATGTFSTISYLSKVWVFFYGGDIQRPVYFAQVTNPYSIGEAYQTNPELFERARQTG